MQSFAETHERALRLAGALESLGCGPGSRVGIMATNGPWFVELYFAVCEAGMIEVPINLRFTSAELSGYLNHVKPDVIIATPDFAVSARDVQAIVPSVRNTIGVGNGHGLEHDYEAVLARATPSERPLRDPDETVLVCSTSGTLGNAKAVRHTQCTTASGYQPLIERFEVDETSHVVTGLPMYFATAYSGWTMSFVAGAQQSLIPAFDPHGYVDLVEAVQGSPRVPRARAGQLHPGRWHRTEPTDVSSISLPGWRALRPSATADTGRRARRPRGHPVRDDRSLDRDIARRIRVRHSRPRAVAAPPIDRPAIRRSRRADRRRRRRTEMPFDGEARGELELSGRYVTPGYLDNPIANAEAFDDGWLRTGDVAVIDRDRNVWLVDRKKDIIVSGGINIAPNEVEQTIGQHPDVVAVGVCGIPDRVFGEAVHASVVRASGSSLSKQDVIEWCNRYLASVKKPRSVEFVDALPVSSTGKLLRRELRARAEGSHGTG